MADRDLNEEARRDAAAGTTGMSGTSGMSGDTDLRRLSELDDYEVADGYPDIRGWEVKTPDGRMLGKVDDLVVSVREMRVRYLDVDVDRSLRSAVQDAATAKGAEKGHALVPIGTAQLDDQRNDVIVNSLTGTDLASYPTYARTGGITRDYEQSLRGRFGTAGAAGTAAATGATSDDFYRGEHFDDTRFFRNRGGGAAATGAQGREITPAELDAAANSSGTGGMAAGDASDASDASSSYFRRRGATERDVSPSLGAGSGAADRATSSGPMDRLADKVDDVKDRFDGNPASRPGPDSTDRRI